MDIPRVRTRVTFVHEEREAAAGSRAILPIAPAQPTMHRRRSGRLCGAALLGSSGPIIWPTKGFGHFIYYLINIIHMRIRILMCVVRNILSIV